MDRNFSHTCEISISKTENIPELMECSLTGDSNKDSKGGLAKGSSCARRPHKGQPSRIHAHMGPLRLPLAWWEHLSPGSPS